MPQLKQSITQKWNFAENLVTLIQDADEFVSSSEQIWRNLALHHLLTMDPLQWMGANRMRFQTGIKTSQYPQVIHTTPENLALRHFVCRVDYLWIIVMFFYQLFGFLFWRHPFTAEDPLVSKWCKAKFVPNLCWWRNKLIYILDDLRVSTFSAIFIFLGELLF